MWFDVILPVATVIVKPRYGAMTRRALHVLLSPVVKKNTGYIHHNTIVDNCVYFTIGDTSYCANTYRPVLHYLNGKGLNPGDSAGKAIEKYLQTRWPKP